MDYDMMQKWATQLAIYIDICFRSLGVEKNMKHACRDMSMRHIKKGSDFFDAMFRQQFKTSWACVF